MGTSVQPFNHRSVRAAQRGLLFTMAELGLKKKEIEAIEFAFDVYDFKGDGKVDAFYAGDLIRACNLTQPSRLLRRSVDRLRRARRCSPRLTSSPCTRHARTPRTRVDSTTLLKSLSSTTKTRTTPCLRMSFSVSSPILVRS